MIPTGLPTTSPARMPMATGSAIVSRRPGPPTKVTPAVRSANNGTAIPAEMGLHRCSRSSIIGSPPLPCNGTATPSRTPAMVAWTPESCISTQAATPTTAARIQGGRRRRASQPKPATQANAPARAARSTVAVKNDGDDQDGHQVVDHRQGQQERAQPGRQMAAEHGEDGEGEGDVGGGGDRPAVERAFRAQVDQDVEEGRDGDPAQGGDHRHHRPAWIPEIALRQLALQLEPDDEEEDRQQPVGRPGRQVEVEVERSRADDRGLHRLVRLPPGRVGPDQSHHGGADEQQTADGLGAEGVGDEPDLGPGLGTPEQRALGGG